MVRIQKVNLQKIFRFLYASSSRLKVRRLPFLSFFMYSTCFKLIFPFSSNFKGFFLIMDIFKPQELVSGKCDLMSIKTKFVKQQRSRKHAQT
jgi:hypothetical protein